MLSTRNLPHSFSIKTFGDSMSPLLLNGDVIYLKNVSYNRIVPDDIITFKANRKFVTHRVIYKNQRYLITKGDNNFSADYKVKPKQIIGKVQKVKRGDITFNIEELYLFQSTHYFQEIIKITKLLQKEKIDFVFLKGLPIHLYYLKKHPRRIYADCDILIKPKSLYKFNSVLSKLKYSRSEKQFPLDDVMKSFAELSYFKMKSGITIVLDVHLEVSFLTYQRGKFNYLYPQDYVNRISSQFLREKEHISLLGYTIPILSKENLIIYLAANNFKDNLREFQRLYLLSKILTIRSSSESTKVVRNVSKKIEEYKLDNFLFPVFYFLHKYYANPMSQKITLTLNPNWLARQYVIRILEKENLFDHKNMHRQNIRRFINLFILSKNPWYQKLFSLIKFQTLLSLGKVALRYFLNLSLKISKLKSNFLLQDTYEL